MYEYTHLRCAEVLAAFGLEVVKSITHGIGEGVVRVWYFESNGRYAALLLFLEPPGADNPLKEAESRQY